MNVLVVLAHPVRASFNHALAAAVMEGLREAGHDARLADLNAEGFQPAMIEADFAQFRGEAMPPAIQAEQARVEWSDAMVFVFPIWWWSLPAMLKGWIDRVMAYGFAWDDPSDPDSGGLRHRRVLVLPTAGASAEAFAKRGYDKALQTQLNVGTWDYCGMKDVTTRIFHDLHHETEDATRAAYLSEAKALAAAL